MKHIPLIALEKYAGWTLTTNDADALDVAGEINLGLDFGETWAKRLAECYNAVAGIENPKEWAEAQSSRIAELEEALGNLTDEFSKPDYELIEKAKQLLNK
jgi:hypothetical protein